MNPGDFSPNGSDHLPPDVIPLQSDAHSEISLLLARHLETYEPLAVPPGFRTLVHRRVRNLRRCRDFKLVLAAGSGTGLVLTVIITCALGLDWWRRLLPAIRPQDALAALTALPGHLAAYIHLAEAIEGSLRWFLPFLPVALLLFAIGALALEFAVFRYLHLGPFAPSRRNAP